MLPYENELTNQTAPAIQQGNREQFRVEQVIHVITQEPAEHRRGLLRPTEAQGFRSCGKPPVHCECSRDGSCRGRGALASQPHMEAPSPGFTWAQASAHRDVGASE